MNLPAAIVLGGLLAANLITTMATYSLMNRTAFLVDEARESAEQAASYATRCSQDLEQLLDR